MAILQVPGYPLLCGPIYKHKVWGADSLARLFRRPLPGSDIGESWELVDLESDQSRVLNGPLAGRGLHDLASSNREWLLGDTALFEGRFPLLIKFLDAAEDLSVQVHPTEAVARQLGGSVRVKHEAWYVLESRRRPDGRPAGIYVGAKPGVDLSELGTAARGNELPGLLNFIPVHAGDCFYLPSGTLHALGAGVVVAEVQTPSDITYRLYDWGRSGRELHVDQALSCLDLHTPWAPQRFDARDESSLVLPTAESVLSEPLVRCPYFVMDRLDAASVGTWPVSTGAMRIWMVLSGQVQLASQVAAFDPVTAEPGTTLLLPATMTDTVVRVQKPSVWIDVTVP